MQKLFPDLDQFNSLAGKRQHVSDCLVEMANAGTLYLSECLAHQASTMVREVIHGRDIDGSGIPRAGRPIPRELKRHEIKLRVIPHRVQVDTYSPQLGRMVSSYEEKSDPPVSFKLPRIELAHLTENDARMLGSAGSINQYSSAPAGEANVVDIESKEFMLPLDEAIFCLDQCGKGVRRARSVKQQAIAWKVEEVHPSGSQPAPKKRGRGRPRKVAASV